MAMSYLEVRNLQKRFGDFTALGDVSLDVAEGEFVCFLGPSGCGKTTLLRAIAGLDPQTSGTIHQKGRDVSALPPAAARRDRQAGRRASGAGRPARIGAEISRPALGRPAAARGARPRACDLALAAAARRASLGARRAR